MDNTIPQSQAKVTNPAFANLSVRLTAETTEGEASGQYGVHMSFNDRDGQILNRFIPVMDSLRLYLNMGRVIQAFLEDESIPAEQRETVRNELAHLKRMDELFQAKRAPLQN